MLNYRKKFARIFKEIGYIFLNMSQTHFTGQNKRQVAFTFKYEKCFTAGTFEHFCSVISMILMFSTS